MLPYRKLLLASAFSPRFLPLLVEANRFAARLGTTFDVVFSGELDQRGHNLYSKAFRDLGFTHQPKVHSAPGTPVNVILDTVRATQTDLLMLGALETELGGRNFAGDVARGLMRDAPCSMMIFTKPSLEKKAIRHIAVVSDYSPGSARALKEAIALGEQDGATSIQVIRILTVFAQVLHAREADGEPLIVGEERRMDKFIAEAGPSSVEIGAGCIEGTTGFAACDFIKDIKADLLVLPAAAPGCGQLFPHGMDWLLDVIPTNLLIVR